MANRLRFKVDGGPTTTSSTSQISLGTVNLTAVPGFGDVDALTRWSMVMITRVAALHNGGEHGARIWELVSACQQNSSGGFSITTPPVAHNAAALGSLLTTGDIADVTFAWDNSSDVVRFRVTPSSSDSTIWMATHDVEILIP